MFGVPLPLSDSSRLGHLGRGTLSGGSLLLRSAAEGIVEAADERVRLGSLRRGRGGLRVSPRRRPVNE